MSKLVTTLSFVFLLFITNKLQAQYLEIGGMAGGTSYFGDLQKFKPELGSFGPTVALMARWNRSPRIAFRATAMYGSFNASDARALTASSASVANAASTGCLPSRRYRQGDSVILRS